MQAQMVILYAAKRGNDEREWEDGAAGSCADPRTGRNPRFAVADGATEGFGSARWAHQLVTGFVDPERAERAERSERPGEPPTLGHDDLHRYLRVAQDRWHRDPRLAGASDLERLKLARVGSFATLVGCELSGLTGPEPRWDAVALGDSVLFHVRGDQLVTQFPLIDADGFGVNPDGVSTKPEHLAGAVSRLTRRSGRLSAGDRLYLATDAFAQWMVATDRSDPRALWDTLAVLDHPGTFRALVADRRAAGEMTNDDVTLLRVHLVETGPRYLVVCL
jgi:hypothetical protein